MKSVELKNAPVDKYQFGGAQTLVDGLRKRHIDNPFVEIRLNVRLDVIKVPGIAVTFGIVYVLQAFKTACELFQILPFRLRPLHLGHSRQAWQKHIFGQVELGRWDTTW